MSVVCEVVTTTQHRQTQSSLIFNLENAAGYRLNCKHFTVFTEYSERFSRPSDGFHSKRSDIISYRLCSKRYGVGDGIRAKIEKKKTDRSEHSCRGRPTCVSIRVLRSRRNHRGQTPNPNAIPDERRNQKEKPVGSWGETRSYNRRYRGYSSLSADYPATDKRQREGVQRRHVVLAVWMSAKPSGAAAAICEINRRGNEPTKRPLRHTD